MDNQKVIVKEDESFKEEGQKIFSFFKTTKGRWFLVGFLFLAIIILGSCIRVQNLNLLVDSTTGEHIPLALDPFYFLRIAETIVDTGGGLPDVDNMRVLEGGVSFINEILPQSVVFMWKIANIFGDYSLRYIDVISPVVFFILGMVVFFFLIYSLTNSKMTALLSSFFLSIIPSYLYRTMAGFSDHEAIGMFAFFLTLLIFSYALKFLDREKSEKNWLFKTVLFGIGTAFATAFTIASWGGVSKLIFMIIPLASLIFWLINSNKKNGGLKKCLIFYPIWFVFSFVFGGLFGFNIVSIFKVNVLSSSGLIAVFVLMFIFVDYLMIRNRDFFKKIIKNFGDYRIFYSVLATIILGLVFLVVSGRDIFSLFRNLIEGVLNPFGRDRLGLTVAENKQPYLAEWIGQTGKTIFYLFLTGIFFLGLNISKGIKKLSYKILFNASWILLVLGIVFSRISPSSILNGNNFVSSAFYFLGLMSFVISFIYIYLKKDIKVNSRLIVILSIVFLVIIAGRGALRLFFVITPFMVFMAIYSIPNLYRYARDSKEEITKILFYVGLGIAIISLLIASFGMISSSNYQGKYTGPSANMQWQNAMSWVRSNTPEGSVFSHWWDYGYWVEYLGERPTIADGGHFQGTFRDHMIGRYILTEPEPMRSLSFMKSNGVDYLLIDQTDIGKYPAYSSIGSSNDWDRFASITALNVDPSQIRETANGERRIYQGVSGVGDDIIYEENGSVVFLPGATFDKFGSPNYKTFLIGVILNIDKTTSNESFKISQPRGVFVYEGRQVKIPLKYVYYQGRELKFSEGINAGIQIIPRVYQNPQGFQVDYLGSAFYFSPRTIDGLLVQLFLLNDPRDSYPTVKLAYKEESPIVAGLKSQGAPLEDFIVYQGVQGPIKIWEVGYPDDIIEREEFTRKIMEWAEFDELEVRG